MVDKFLQNQDFVYEKVNRSSQACGPLVKWVRAQVAYSDLLKQIEPLHMKLTTLEHELGVNRQQADATDARITELERTSSQMKAEYSVLIAQIHAIENVCFGFILLFDLLIVLA